MTRRFTAALLGLLMPMLFPIVSVGMEVGVARPLPTVLATFARPAPRRHHP